MCESERKRAEKGKGRSEQEREQHRGRNPTQETTGYHGVGSFQNVALDYLRARYGTGGLAAYVTCTRTLWCTIRRLQQSALNRGS